LNRILWTLCGMQKKPLKPAEVREKINKSSAYTTIMTVMKRLTDKGLLKRRRLGKVYYYSPAKQKKVFAKKSLGNLFKYIMNSYGELAISQFLDTIKSNPSDMEKLKQFLDTHEE